MKSKYNKENYVHIEDYWQKYMPKVLLDHYGKYFTGTIGDFGCNTGLFDLHIAQLPEVKQVIGFDVNLEAIEKANEFANEKKVENVVYHYQNLADKIWLKECFDFAICFHTLEHIFPEDIPPVIKNITTTIKQNGHILINMPDKNSYPWESSHVYHPNKEELNELFENHGFQTVESYEDERGGQHGASRNITALYKKIS
jgi:2-polyprenyl-3-methyl-5-hydroxy-6-metoxy-1,4-benzoquinol methylase